MRLSNIARLVAANGVLAVGLIDCSASAPGSGEAGHGGMSTGGSTQGGAGAASTAGGRTGTTSNGGLSGETGSPNAGTTSASGGTSDGGSAPSDAGTKNTGGTTSSAGSSSRGGSAAMGGAGHAGAAGGIAGGSGAPAATGEDEGANCTISGLPDSGSLSTISKAPDPFKKLDGTRVSTKAEWRCRREEIKQLAERFAYGVKPPKPETISGTVSSSSITVNVTDHGKSTKFTVTIKLPTGGSAPYPAIIVYGGASFGSPMDSGVINSEGVALINYDQYAVGKETGQRTPKTGAFYDVYGNASTTGFLQAWGWGVSRILDVIEQSDGKILRADAIGVTGCSRLGKGAIVAGAFDQRIALTMPVESGTAGVPLWRGVASYGGQSLQSAYDEQPWFGDAFGDFTKNPTKAPLDTHELLAMVAPRGLFIMENPGNAHLAAKAGHAAALLGAEAYKSLGAGDNITYWSDVASTAHCSQRPEWVAPLKSNIEKFLKKTGNDPGVFKAAASVTAKLADWQDWETPVLK